MRPYVVLAAILTLTNLASRGQQAPAFRSSVDVVPVYATVTNTDGSFARDLVKDDFTVLDDAKPQDISTFSSDAQAISVSVVLDTSGSMAESLPRVFRAASTFLDQLTADDRAMVGSLMYVGPPFTSDKARLRTSLDLLPRDPSSPVWAALDRSLTTLAVERNRPVIVIYTDGQNADRSRIQVKRSQLLPRVESGSVMVYAIGFEGVSISKDMKNIATRSGGRATELRATDDLASALTAVADELHHQYLLGFTPKVFDGKIHKLEVRVAKPGLIVRARQSYQAVKR